MSQRYVTDALKSYLNSEVITRTKVVNTTWQTLRDFCKAECSRPSISSIADDLGVDSNKRQSWRSQIEMPHEYVIWILISAQVTKKEWMHIKSHIYPAFRSYDVRDQFLLVILDDYFHRMPFSKKDLKIYRAEVQSVYWSFELSLSR